MNFHAAYAVMPAAMFALPALVKSACLITPNPALRTKRHQTHLRKRCSILSVHSTLSEDVRTAENVRVFVRSISHCILLNRKFIKDIDNFYGEYQAGAEVGSRAPIVNYTTEDLEPAEAVERGDENA